MAKNKPTKQHYVPQCYLREFADPTIPPNKEPSIWIFSKKGKNQRREKIKNTLASNDLYTLKVHGQKNYVIEETLASLEGKYAAVFRTKIKNRLPLNEEEHIILCAFVSVMLQRTLRHKDNLEQFYSELIERAEFIEKAHNLPPKESVRLKRFKQDAHKLNVFGLLPDITELLMKMGVAFLCANGSAKFITSDDPCNLFNPDLQWQKFYGPGLGQKSVQVTLPLSPDIMLCLSWSNLRGYIGLGNERVNESNRMIVGHCYRYFVSHSKKTKMIWFFRYPLNPIFLFKVVRRRVRTWIDELRFRYKFRYVRKR
ncbi:MAG: DUF4238 domain-containing protein [Candidatus Andersenbacteria bacterium]|nr:DUF4238 domain-containing protein [Candidatus Andersenbacteria bacterium]